MRSQDIVAARGGHKVISAGTAYDNEDYHFYGFIPHADVTIKTLKMGTVDLSTVVDGVTYKAGIYYPMPAKVQPGYGTDIELESGSGDCMLILTLNSPNHY